MNIVEFELAFPEYAFDFDEPIRDQPRVLMPAILDVLPVELTSKIAYHPGGRGRPNRNQTRAHSQCATCHRILRNDLFFTPKSLLRRNMIYSHCRECSQTLNAERYELNSDAISRRRAIIWQYLAPQCVICGFDRHHSALDMHHILGKESEVTELITYVTLVPSITSLESLLVEARRCVALCSNCHRMLHAGVVTLPNETSASRYDLVELAGKLGITKE